MLPAILGIGSLIGSLMGAGAKGRADGRQQAADTNLQRDQLTSQQWQAGNNNQLQNASILNQMALGKAGTELQQRQFANSAPMDRYRQAITGNLAQNMQDVSASHPRANVVHFSGGARPSAIGAGGRAAGKALADDAMMRLMAGDKFDPIQTTTPQLNTQAPGLTALPKSGLLDKILGIGGYVGAGAGLLQQIAPGLGLPKDLPGGTQNGMPPLGGQVDAFMPPPTNMNAKQLIFGGDRNGRPWI